MVPSLSVEVLPLVLTVRLLVVAVNRATGGAFGGGVSPVETVRLSYRTRSEAIVAEPLSDVRRATGPALCRAGVESVACSCHAAGSDVPTFQNFAASAVGFVPRTDTRTLTSCPAA